MKKIFLITCILFTTMAFSYNYGQNLDIDVISETVSTPNKSDGTVQITVTSGNGPYIFYLYDDLPWENGKLIKESRSINQDIYVFKKLKTGKYFAGVVDNEDKSTFKLITVDSADNK